MMYNQWVGVFLTYDDQCILRLIKLDVTSDVSCIDQYCIISTAVESTPRMVFLCQLYVADAYVLPDAPKVWS